LRAPLAGCRLVSRAGRLPLVLLCIEFAHLGTVHGVLDPRQQWPRLRDGNAVCPDLWLVQLQHNLREPEPQLQGLVGAGIVSVSNHVIKAWHHGMRWAAVLVRTDSVLATRSCNSTQQAAMMATVCPVSCALCSEACYDQSPDLWWDLLVVGDARLILLSNLHVSTTAAAQRWPMRQTCAPTQAARCIRCARLAA
jgi:hypothetical protein